MKKILYSLIAVLAMSFVSPDAFAGRPQKKTETVTFVTTMECKNCEKKVIENISFEKGVVDLKTDLKTRTVTVVFDAAKTDTQKLADAIRKLGFKAEVKK